MKFNGFNGGSTGERTHRQGEDSNGHCTEPEEGGECRRDVRRWIYVLTDGPGASSVARESCGGDSKAKVRYLGSRPTRNMSFATERETQTAAAWNAWQMLGEFCTAKVDFKTQVQTSPEQAYKAHCSQACALLRDKMEASQRTSCERRQKKVARRLLAMTRRNWDSEPKKEAGSEQRATSKAWNCANCNGTQNSTPRVGQKDDRTNPKTRLFPQQVLAATFGQTRLDRHPCMASDGKLTMYATPWAMQFRDDINSLEEF